jgi:hypothetical protein
MVTLRQARGFCRDTLQYTGTWANHRLARDHNAADADARDYIARLKHVNRAWNTALANGGRIFDDRAEDVRVRHFRRAEQRLDEVLSDMLFDAFGRANPVGATYRAIGAAWLAYGAALRATNGDDW